MRKREHQTKKQCIDLRLKAVDWPAVPLALAVPIEAYSTLAAGEIGTANGPADYALSDQGCILAVVKAKKLAVGPRSVLTQAEQYSKEALQIPLVCQAKPYDLISTWVKMGSLQNRTVVVTVQASEAHWWRSNHSLSGCLKSHEVSEV